jgi:hypothetical protein
MDALNMCYGAQNPGLTWKTLSQNASVSGFICPNIRSSRSVVQVHNLSDAGLDQCLEPIGLFSIHIIDELPLNLRTTQDTTQDLCTSALLELV